MSGHSKWATIKRKKAKTDNARASQWNKLIKEIVIAAKMGGGDPDSNTRLRAAILKAKGQSLPTKNIDSSIKKGVGGTSGEVHEDVMYEGYGPGGTAFLVKGLTDNKTRTVAEVRNIFSKGGGSMGEPGSVAWGFDHVGLIHVEESAANEEKLFEVVSEAGAEDMESGDEVFEVKTSPETFFAVTKALDKAGIVMASAELSYIPQNPQKVSGEDAEKIQRLMDRFEDNDDVQDVYTSAEFPDGGDSES